MPHKMIIDTDTASDDAVALLMALVSPVIELVVITIVAGNVDMQQGSRNARYTVELCGRATPVYEGALEPLVRETHRAEFFHGSDGMGITNYPPPKTPAAKRHAVDALIEHIQSNPGIVLVSLGPLANVALAIKKAPEIVGDVSRCIVMGRAACTVGDITPAAEYNIWCDPEAAQICFHSGHSIEMVGWELCRGAANLDQEDRTYYKEIINTPLSHFVIDCNASALQTNREWLGDRGIGLPDPVAMAIAIDPALCTRHSRHFVEVECEGKFTRGMTVVDQLRVTQEDTASVAMWQGAPQIRVCWELDIPGWKALLERCARSTM